VKTGHSAHPKEVTSATPSGKLNHLQHPFNWKMATKRALELQLRRSISLATCNPDYKIQYPNECRDNPENKLTHNCHPEAEKRLLKDHQAILAKSLVPTVERPQRMNRLG